MYFEKKEIKKGLLLGGKSNVSYLCGIENLKTNALFKMNELKKKIQEALSSGKIEVAFEILDTIPAISDDLTSIKAKFNRAKKDRFTLLSDEEYGRICSQTEMSIQNLVKNMDGGINSIAPKLKLPPAQVIGLDSVTFAGLKESIHKKEFVKNKEQDFYELIAEYIDLDSPNLKNNSVGRILGDTWSLSFSHEPAAFFKEIEACLKGNLGKCTLFSALTNAVHADKDLTDLADSEKTFASLLIFSICLDYAHERDRKTLWNKLLKRFGWLDNDRQGLIKRKISHRFINQYKKSYLQLISDVLTRYFGVGLSLKNLKALLLDLDCPQVIAKKKDRILKKLGKLKHKISTIFKILDVYFLSIKEHTITSKSFDTLRYREHGFFMPQNIHLYKEKEKNILNKLHNLVSELQLEKRDEREVNKYYNALQSALTKRQFDYYFMFLITGISQLMIYKQEKGEYSLKNWLD